MNCMLIIRISVFLLLAGIELIATTSTAAAFSPQSPGTVVHDYATGLDQYNRHAAIEYMGVNADGNYVVAVLQNSAVNTIHLSTYEIASSGTVLGGIDSSGTLTSINGQAHDIVRWADTDYFVLSTTSYLALIEISSEGYINPNGIVDTIADQSYETLTLHYEDTDTDVILSRSWWEYRSFEIDAEDEEIDAMDTCATGTKVQYNSMCFLETVDNIEYRPFMSVVFDACGGDRNNYLVGQVMNDHSCSGIDRGDIGYLTPPCNWHTDSNYYTDEVCATHIGYEPGCYSIYSGAGNVYLTAGPVKNTYGHAGNTEIGVELWVYLDGEITETDYAWLQENRTNVAGIERMGNGHVAIYYRDDSVGDDQLLMSMIYSIGDDGSIDQNQITSGIDLGYYATSYVDYCVDRVCRLGTSNLTAIAWRDASAYLDIVIVEHRIPPTVETTELIPLSTDYNSWIDAAFYAAGEVTDIGDSAVTEWGICYNSTGSPDYSGSRVFTTGTKTAPWDFDDQLLDLDPADRYYVRAYACNASGTGYGDTLDSYGFPDYAYTVALWQFEPLQISSGTITDVTGNGHDISYTLFDPGLNITIHEIVPTDISSYLCEGTECYHYFDSQFVTPPDYILGSGSANYNNLPGMEVINSMLPDNSVPVRVYWVAALTIIMCAIGFGIAKYTDELLMVAAMSLVIILIATIKQWLSPWVLVICIILTPGLLLKKEAKNPFG